MRKLWFIIFVWAIAVHYLLDIKTTEMMDSPLKLQYSKNFENYIYYKDGKMNRPLSFMFKLKKEMWGEYIQYNKKMISKENIMKGECPVILELLKEYELKISELPDEIIKNLDEEDIISCKVENVHKGYMYTEKVLNIVEYLSFSEKSILNENVSYLMKKYYLKDESRDVCTFFHESFYTVGELYKKEFYSMYNELLPRVVKCRGFRDAKLDIIKTIYPKIEELTDV